MFKNRGFKNKAQIYIHGGQMKTWEAEVNLTSHHADQLPDNGKWLLRQSTSYPKQVVVTYYRQETPSRKAGVVHTRYGLTQDGWEKAPAPQDKNFSEKMKAFNAEILSINPINDASMSTLNEQTEVLLDMLSEQGFEKNKLIKPTWEAQTAFVVTEAEEENTSRALMQP